MLSNNQQAFLELVRAGLWEKEAQLSPFYPIDFKEIYRLAQEQTVVGLVASGLEHVADTKIPSEVALTFAGEALQLERRNSAMNRFVGVIVDKMRVAGIYTLLVKGQGVAQCYEHPLWRSCGDVDLLLSCDNYDKAKLFLVPKASKVDFESVSDKHLGMTIEQWVVELHGSLHTELSSRVDKIIDSVQDDVFYHGGVRCWMCGETQVFLPSPDNDIIFIFTHYLKHFYKGGLGLRQICDWCRLIWVFKNSINHSTLESRICEMGLMTEWKAFGAFAVEWLRMPSETLPFHDKSNKWTKKAKYICEFILEVGNMGHNRDMSFYNNKSFLRRKIGSFRLRIGDLLRHARLFPIDSFRFFPNIVFNGVRSAIKGVG